MSISVSLTRTKMRLLLQGYNLPGISGSRADMLARLVTYAQDQTLWISQFAATPSRTRGSMTGASANKVSAKRIRDQFDPEDAVSGQHRSKKAALNMPDSRSSADAAKVDDWVSCDDACMSSAQTNRTYLVISGKHGDAAANVGKAQPAASTSTPKPCCRRARRIWCCE